MNSYSTPDWYIFFFFNVKVWIEVGENKFKLTEQTYDKTVLSVARYFFRWTVLYPVNSHGQSNERKTRSIKFVISKSSKISNYQLLLLKAVVIYLVFWTKIIKVSKKKEFIGFSKNISLCKVNIELWSLKNIIKYAS